MDVDNSANDSDASPVSNKVKEGAENHVNGLNGYSDKNKSHKSEHKDKHRDKDKDKDRSKDHKSSSRDKDRDKHHSSSKDKDRHSSHKSSSKDKDRDKEKNRDKDKHRDKEKDKHRDDKKKDKEHKSSHDKEKEHKSSSKDKERDRDKEKKDKDKEKDRDRDKHKDKHRDKHSSSKDKHRDKERDKDKHHSSSKDKDRKDRDREKDKKDKDKSSDENLKIKTESDIKEETKVKVEGTDHIKYESEIKLEAGLKEEVADQHVKYENSSDDDDEEKLVIKDDPQSQDEDGEEQNLSQASSCDYSLSQFKKDESQFDVSEEEEASAADEAKDEEESDEDVPLSARISSTKRKLESDDEEDDVPLTARKKAKVEKSEKKKKKKRSHEDDDEDFDEEEEEEYKPQKKVKKQKKEKESKEKKKGKQEEKMNVSQESSPGKKAGGRKKKEEEAQDVWKWWEEEKRDDGVKWTFLEHKGPIFAPPYERLPDDVKFYYDGKEVKLSEEAEEVAGFYAKMLDHDYTTKEIFNKNFFKDWRKVMTEKERELITDLKKCNFNKMNAYFKDLTEKNKNRTKEEKQALKEKNEQLIKEYGFCTIDGHKEKIGNFKIEPPGLFRGRGEHPKMGKLKKRIEAEDIIINCSADSAIPVPPKGHKWKEVRHLNTVTWLASWTENVQNQVKYIMLNPSSKLKGEKDWQKYETARRLHRSINKIREDYQRDWKSKEMKVRQRAVALYFIDKLALRAGNEKDEDQADTVGCCSLRVEHIELHEKKDDKDYVVVFDFLGKDSIRYYNEVPVEKRVFKNLQLFMENKKEGDDLFDRLNTQILNKHLTELMEGLTAKVFRTYNASWTLQQQLDLLTKDEYTVAEKILAYNRANRAVAVLCNHQRSVPKTHEKSMEKLKEKIEAKREAVRDAERQVKDAVKEAKHGSVKEKVVADKKKKLLQRLKEQLTKLEIQETDRDENKTIALGTSKLNYLDPRISVAWCKKYEVPIEKIYNKTQRDKFRWAIDMAGPDYRF